MSSISSIYSLLSRLLSGFTEMRPYKSLPAGICEKYRRVMVMQML